MKFLVIARNTGADADLKPSADEARGHADTVATLKQKGHIEAAYAFVGGGYVYVIEADNSRDLAVALRRDPLFNYRHTEVHPIIDAEAYLKGYAEYVD